MAVKYTNAAKLARMNATRTHFGGGSLEIRKSDEGVLATFTLTADAGSCTTDYWDLAFSANTVTAGAGGLAAKAVIKRSAGNGSAADIYDLTVGTSGTDIVLDNTTINASQSVTLSSARITHAT